MDLNEAQKRAVSHKEGPCLVLAGPGSGKTFTIVKRIEYLMKYEKVRPEEILVVTFTKYAANEMKERFCSHMKGRSVPVTVGTFHGIYYGILKWAYRLGRDNILSDEERMKLLKEITASVPWEEMPQDMEEKDFLKDLSEAIGNIKNKRLDLASYEPARYSSSWFREVFTQYEETKKKWKKIDFEDMLILCLELFEKRPDILKKWQQKFRYILIDEFQDINQVQYDVIRMLALPENNLFVVGDDDQSIYGFRGARPAIMQDFLKDYPQAEKVVLDVNYRSTAHIVHGAQRVIGHNTIRYEKEVRACREADETVHVQETRDEKEEAQYILEQFERYKKQGVAAEEMAVLFRTAADASALAELFTQLGIPFFMREHIHHAYEHFICMDLECYFRMAAGRGTRRDLLQIANRPNRYLARDSMSERKVSYESLRNYYCDKDWMQDRIDQMEWDIRMLAGKTPYAAIQYVRKQIGYNEFLKTYAPYRGLDMQELEDTFRYIEERAKPFKTIEEWLDHVEEYRELLRRRAGEQKDGEGVQFLTIHGAKGLEYDVVFVIGCNEGVLPYKKAKTPEEIEEERRLLYVAMTRARQKLVLSYVKEKNGKDADPSRFLDELFSLA